MSKLQRKPAGLRLAPINLKASTSATTSASASAQATLNLKPSHSFESTSSWREDIARITLSTAPTSPPNDSDSASTQTIFIRQYGELKPEEFENIKKLGEGASGTVMKVLHKPSNLVMAKKSITTDPDPDVQRQILRELSFLKTCHSPQIVSFYGAFLDDGDTTIAICMEYCEAGSLEDIYKRAKELGGVIGEPVLAKIAESVCLGLVYLHSKQVIHRDIKPSNILINKAGNIKLCDLGVSGELINSLAQTFTGTKYYMAPERIKGAQYSVQSDIWSLGLTIIEVAQNAPALPPPGQPHLSIFELLDYIVRQPVPTIGNDRSTDCRDFVATCLIKDPNDRPGPKKMLDHPFLKQWSGVEVDIASWIKEVWGWQ
ncbi:kinase-like domain-containing protein [Umbelopsis sp. PMI_123]|nr:kinase-like domain-containing protein [Umbelopsis sp. PMI_123]